MFKKCTVLGDRQNVQCRVRKAVGKKWYTPSAWDFWKLFLPVPFIGLPLYYMKKHHIGSPRGGSTSRRLAFCVDMTMLIVKE